MNDYLFLFKLKTSGEYNYISKNVKINPARINHLKELYEVLQHEDIHKALDTLKIKMSDKKEHRIIYIINWYDEYV